MPRGMSIWSQNPLSQTRIYSLRFLDHLSLGQEQPRPSHPLHVTLCWQIFRELAEAESVLEVAKDKYEEQQAIQMMSGWTEPTDEAIVRELQSAKVPCLLPPSLSHQPRCAGALASEKCMHLYTQQNHEGHTHRMHAQVAVIQRQQAMTAAHNLECCAVKCEIKHETTDRSSNSSGCPACWLPMGPPYAVPQCPPMIYKD